MADDSDSYSIVVTGAMNPAIHQPSWYGFAGIIEDNQLGAANSDPNLRSGPKYSGFNTGSFRIECGPEQWQIHVGHPGLVDEMLRVACRTFEILEHTPVTGFGLNSFFHRETGLDYVGGKLAALVRSLHLGLDVEAGHPSSATIGYWFRADERDVHIELQPSLQDNSMVFVAVSAQHRIEAEGSFDLSPLLRRAIDTDLPMARATVERVVAALTG